MRYTVIEFTRATRAWAEDDWIWIRLQDGRAIRFPNSICSPKGGQISNLSYQSCSILREGEGIANPINRKLRNATPSQRKNIELICDGTGLHWPDLDEDLSADGILEGRLGAE